MANAQLQTLSPTMLRYLETAILINSEPICFQQNNSDYLLTRAPNGQWPVGDILTAANVVNLIGGTVILEVHCWKSGENMKLQGAISSFAGTAFIGHFAITIVIQSLAT